MEVRIVMFKLYENWFVWSVFKTKNKVWYSLNACYPLDVSMSFERLFEGSGRRAKFVCQELHQLKNLRIAYPRTIDTSVKIMVISNVAEKVTEHLY
jgi:hypothetical protein